MARRRKQANGLKSMTGFGRGQSKAVSNGSPRAEIEIRAVNQRFLKLALKLPPYLAVLETRVREAVRQRLRRGTVDVYARIRSGPDPGAAGQPAAVDEAAVRAYVTRWRELAAQLDLSGELSVNTLAGLPDLFLKGAAAPQPEALWPAIDEALQLALDDLEQMRAREGAALARDLIDHVKKMRAALEKIKRRAPRTIAAYRKKLTARVRELLTDQQWRPARGAIESEVVLCAERADISEEITRLDSHLDQFAAALKTNGEIGKRLEFLAQEMHREINTIGSKAADEKISTLVVEMKSQLEKIREQSANVE